MGNRKVLVTGGTRGISKAIAIEYARAGFDVAFTDRTANPGEMREINEDGSHTPTPGSLSETNEAVEAFGVQSIPIYESGAYTTSWIKDIPMEAFRRKMEANFFAPLAITKGLLPSMLERKHGRVINLATRHNYTAQSAPPGQGSATACYNASKAAEGKIADGLATEHGQDGISAFALDPGPVWIERADSQGDRLGFPKSIFCPIEVPARVAVWLGTEKEAEQYNGSHFMAQEFALQRGLHEDWGGSLPMSKTWKPGGILDWVEPRSSRRRPNAAGPEKP